MLARRLVVLFCFLTGLGITAATGAEPPWLTLPPTPTLSLHQHA